MHADILPTVNETIFISLLFKKKAEKDILIFAQLKLLNRYFIIVPNSCNSRESKAFNIVISKIIFLCHT